MRKLFHKDYIFCFLFFIFFLSLVLLDNDVNSKVLIILLIFSLFSFKLDSFKIKVKKNFPLIAFFILNLLSLTYSSDIASGFKHIEKLAIIPACLVVYSAYSKKQISLSLISFIYISIIIIATTYSHFKVISLFIENEETSYRHFFNLNYSYKALGNTIGLHTTYYSMYILIAIIFLLDFLTRATKSIVKILVMLLIIYLSIFIFQLSSRIAIVTLYIIVLFNIIVHFIITKKLVKAAVIIGLFHIVAYGILMNIGVTKYRFQHLLGFSYYTGYTVNDSDHKIKLWTAAVNANNNPIFGNGIGDVQQSLDIEYKRDNLQKPLKEGYNSHNQYIEYYVGLGIIGLLFFIYIFIYYLYEFYKTKNYIGIQFILVIAIISFTECIWNRHNGIVFLVFWLFILTNSYPLRLTKPKLPKAMSENKNPD